MAGNPVASLEFDQHGPVNDRRWMLIDSSGKFVSQRGFPFLGQFKATIEGEQLNIAAPDGKQVTVSAHECTRETQATVWSDDVAVLMVPDPINQWLSSYFPEPVCLVRYRTDQP